MNDLERSLDVRVEPKTKTTIFGKIRTHADLSKLEWAFLIISAITVVITVALTIVTLLSVTNDVDRTLGLILLVHTVLCAYYVIDGVFRERPYEVVIYVISVCVVLGYILINFFAHMSVSVTNPVKIVRLVFSGLFVPPNVVLGIYVAVAYTRTGNLVFRTVGAQIMLQSACRLLFLFEGVLKFDCHMSILMLLLVRFDAMSTFEIVLIAVGAPFVVIWLVCGFCAAVFEHRYLMYAFWATCYLQPAYICYQLYRAVRELEPPEKVLTTPTSTVTSTYSSGGWMSQSEPVISTTSTMVLSSTALPPMLPLSLIIFVVAALSLVIRVFLMVVSILVYRNFGKGLKQRIKFGVQQSDERSKLIGSDRRERQPERERLVTQSNQIYTGQL